MNRKQLDALIQYCTHFCNDDNWITRDYKYRELLELFDCGDAPTNKFDAEAMEVLTYLNEQAGKKFTQPSRIAARLRDGYTVKELCDIVDLKCDEWIGRKNMYRFLRPATLFGSVNKIELYSQEVVDKRNYDARVSSNKAETNVVKAIPDWDK